MTSQPVWQTIAIYIVPSITQSKGNLAVKFLQLIEHSIEIVFFRNHAENEAGRLVTDLFFKKVLNEVKASGLLLSFNIFR